MTVELERYEEQWNGNTYSRVAFIFPYHPGAKDALKVALPFPACKWDGERKVWGVRDNPADLQTAVVTLAKFGLHFAPLVDALTPAEVAPLATFSAPDAIILDWPFRPNWRDIVTAVKSLGNANFNQQTKVWSIPLHTAHQIANAIEPHYAELAEDIRALPEVAGHVEAAVERVSLSQAARLDDESEVRSKVALTQGEPFPHQWVAPAMFTAGDQHRLLIADEPGLGKSLQALMSVDAAGFGNVLIVCPANVKYTWENECAKWYPWHARYVVKNGKDELQSASFTIINYELLTKRLEELKATDYDCIIFDESHYLKNENSQRTKASLALVNWPTVKGLLCMSGTPILNRPAEFYNVLRMLMPGTFGNWFDFVKRYAGAYKGDYGWVTTGATNIDSSDDGSTLPLNHLLRDMMLRRTYDDEGIAESMPDLVQTRVIVPLAQEQRARYDSEYDRWMDEYDRLNAMGSLPPGYALNLLTELRHLCGEMKVKHAVEWAKDYRRQTGKPLVIFAHHLDVLNSINRALVNNHYVDVISGATPAKHRQGVIDRFQEGDLDFLICSTLAAKEGITLDNADTTLFVEREWVPAWEQQAAHRVRRVSQKASVCHQVILSAADSIDVHFDKVVAAKAEVIKRALDGDAEERAQGDIVKGLLASLRGVSA